MPLAWLDHVNIRTANLATMSRFYEEVLGMQAGPRPDFSFGGRWHYCGDRAVVHLVQTDAQPAGHEPLVEHFAFRASDYAAFVASLDARGIEYDRRDVPPGSGLDLVQVHIRDPDGNHVEIAFDRSVETIA